MSKVFCIDSKRYIEEPKSLSFTGKTETIGFTRCAVLSDGSRTYLKPWDWITFLRRPGEANISAKLNVKQVKEIVKLAYTKSREEMSFVAIAEKFGVNAKTASDIAHGRAWRHVTRDYIKFLQSGEKEVENSCISASNDRKKKNTKINAAIAKFIVRDYMMHNIPVKKLAEKYCISKSSIKRIISGKAWMSVTIPTIAECCPWVKK